MFEPEEKWVDPTEENRACEPTPTLRINKRIGDIEITVEVDCVDKVLPTCGDVAVFTKAVLNGDDE